jgi:high-affinity iron transporter
LEVGSLGIAVVKPQIRSLNFKTFVEERMLPSFVLSLREGLEAALILSIVLGVLRKMNRPEFRPAVWAGAASAGAASLAAALVLFSVGATLEGAAEQIFEGITMLLAAGVLTWMIFWMHRQGRAVQSDLEAGVRRAAFQGGKQALFSLAFLAVLREGIELALFLTAATFASNALQALMGGILGLAVSAILGWLLFTATLRLNLRRFFLVTGALLILFAAGLTAHGVHEFIEAGWIPAIVEHVWDVNFLLDENSTAGALLKALFGYNGNPALTEVAAYLGYFAAILFGLRRGRRTTAAPQEA